MRRTRDDRLARLGTSLRRSASALGPGVITGAADDDPSGIATYSQAGAQFGYGLLWSLVLCFPLMSAVQLVSAHIGRVTGSGLASNLVATFSKRWVGLLIGILLIANIINIGADLSAMAESASLVAGGGEHAFVIGFAVVSTALQLFIPYHRYTRVLKWLTMSLFAYVGVLLAVRVDWAAAALGMIWPVGLNAQAIVTIVAVLGTTISPYLFFWQSSQEAEDVVDDGDKPLRQSGRGADRQLRRIRFDTITGMAFSNLVSIAIVIAAAATLHQHGSTTINTAAQAAEALRPVAGEFAFALFALGIIGTGFLAVPVLAGSAAFAVAEVFGWKEGLEYQPGQAAGFYSIIVVATLLGAVIDWSPIDPMRALFWSAVLNGLAAVPLMAAMMVVVSRHRVMGRFTASPPVLLFGWTATGVMGVAAVALLLQLAGLLPN
ncbi:MAG TPA: divalent metal cation transporter [Sphingomicrobium sp.]|nr:divalent metal cation transporter [Sphingomicrobium sp.]